jgi:hypothetical protein
LKFFSLCEEQQTVTTGKIFKDKGKEEARVREEGMEAGAL